MNKVRLYIISLFLISPTMAFSQNSYSFNELTGKIFFLMDSGVVRGFSDTAILDYYKSRSDVSYVVDRQGQWNLNMAVWNTQTHTFRFDGLKEWIFPFVDGSIDILMSNSEKESLVIDEIRSYFQFSSKDEMNYAFDVLVEAFSDCSTKQKVKKDRKLNLEVAEFSNENSVIKQVSIIKSIDLKSNNSRQIVIFIGNDLK